MLGYLFTLEKAEEQRGTDVAAKPERATEESRWVRLEQAILRTLLSFPEALRAVSRCIADLEPERAP